MTEHPKPHFQSDVTSEIYEYHKDSDTNAQDLAFVLQRLKEQNATSRMFLHGLDLTKVHKNQQYHSTIGYLPIINLPAHENDTFWTVMMRALQISQAKTLANQQF